MVVAVAFESEGQDDHLHLVVAGWVGEQTARLGCCLREHHWTMHAAVSCKARQRPLTSQAHANKTKGKQLLARYGTAPSTACWTQMRAHACA
jgi:hypothetical protein